MPLAFLGYRGAKHGRNRYGLRPLRWSTCFQRQSGGAEASFWWVTRAFVGVAIIAVIMLGWVNMRQGLIDQGIAQGKQLAQAELSQLRADTKRLRADFNAEIARKKELATLYERAEAARKQAVADHKTLADKLKAYEAKSQHQPNTGDAFGANGAHSPRTIRRGLFFAEKLEVPKSESV